MEKRRAGFTLIEILIALVIMLVGILGIVTLFPPAIKNTAEANRDTEVGFFANTIKTAIEQAMRSAAPGSPVRLELIGLPNNGVMKFPLPKPPGDNQKSKYYMFPRGNVHYPPGGPQMVEEPPAGEGENFEGTSSDKKVYSPCSQSAQSGTTEYLKKFQEDFRKSATGGKGGDTTGPSTEDMKRAFTTICNYSYAFDVVRPELLPYYKFRIKIYSNYENQKKALSDDKIQFETFWIIFSSNGD
ncbi:MAG: prepilin-type N-terminal cleavage/methylation domain-containing protein [Planctomycetota bacterium]